MAVRLARQTAERRAARAGVAVEALGAEPASAGAPPEDFSELGVKELRSRLKAAGLSTSGKKAELVERLAAA